jgi:proteic killer suppression protein
MIKTFHCKETQALFEGKCPRKFKSFANVAERKLQMLDAAHALQDLHVPPGNRLEALRGDRKGQWSIRINDQYRVCFRFEDGNALDVEITDYHERGEGR